MFYEPEKRNHGLPQNPIKALVVPRPIAWISTVDDAGRINLAPYSFYNMVASDPPCVMFATSARLDGTLKDSQDFAQRSGEFVVNIAGSDQREEMITTSFPYPPGQNEFIEAGLEMIASKLVKAPRVKGAPVHLECVYLQTVPLPCNDPSQKNAMVLGRVVGVHIDDRIIVEGKVDIMRMRPISRLGYSDYAGIDSTFVLNSRAGRPVKL